MRLVHSFLPKHGLGLWWLAAWFPLAAVAFPPAPPHLIYGVVRDSLGYPLGDGAEVILEAASGARVRAFVLAEVDSVINYRLQVPMDAGLTDDLYAPTALMPAAPFKLRVRVGNTTFLPIEMTADFSTLGIPGGRTRMDLTLGVDADGNGLPDAWEKAVAAHLGRVWQAGQIHPDDAYPGAGLTYREVYLAGTYAMDPKDGFALQLIVTPGQAPKLAFTAVKGRTYTLQSATVLGEWTATPFRVLPAGASTVPIYQATETKRVEIEAPLVGGAPAQFYRLLVE
jgi:hypothetical protein